MKKQSDPMLALLYRAVRAVGWRLDTGSNRVKCNSDLVKLLGLPDNFDTDAGPFDFWKQNCHPDDKELIESAINSAVREGKELDIELRIILPAGQKHIRCLALAETDAQGITHTLNGICYELQSPALLKQIKTLEDVLSHIPGQVFWKDRHLNYLGCNGVFSEIVGLNSPREVVGKTDFDFQRSSEHAQMYRDDDKRIIDSGEAELEIEEPFHRSDGSEGYVLTSKVPLHDSNGEVNGILGICTDISDRVATEKQLKVALQKLSLMAEGSTDGFWHWVDPQSDKVECNDRFFKMLGYQAQEFAPSFSKFQSMLHPDDVEKTMALVEEAIGNKSFFDTEYRIACKNKQFRWFRGRGKAYFSEDGEFREMAGSISDIHERKLLEFELLESNRRYTLAAEAVGVGLWTWDISTNESYWSPTFFNLLGFQENEIEASFHELEKRLHPDDKDMILAALDAHLNKQGHYNVEFRLLCKSNQYRWFKVKGKAEFDSQGKPVGMAGNLEDIHEKKLLEVENKRLLEVFDTTFDMVSQTSTDLTLLYLNNAFRERIGLHGPLKDIPLNAQHTKDQIRIFKETVVPAILESGIWEGELGIKDKFGNEVPCSCISIAHKNDQGAPEYFTAIFRDISELKLQKEKAEKASIAKSQFLANMSHEIRTPMNGVIGMTNQLLKTELNAQQLSNLLTVKSSANSLLHIINDILDLSKIEAGKLRIEKTPFNLAEVISDTSSTTFAMAQGKNLEYLMNFERSEIPDVFYRGDPTRIRQVLLNLVGNAIKFTDKGQVSLNVKVLAIGEEQDLFRFEVVDSGIGIEEQAKRNLFRPFHQADASTTRKFGGTGLGLNICKQLIELMGGQINFSSQLGRGSRFWFDLPLEKAVFAEPESPQLLPENWESLTYPGAKALLVEDNDINREVAIMSLEQAELKVDSAADGSIALDLIKENQYDIVFMDCQMPVMDGYTATKQIRTLDHAKELPIVALTANAMEGERQKCLEAGMTDYLSKPFEYEDIIKKLDKFLPQFKKVG